MISTNHHIEGKFLVVDDDSQNLTIVLRYFENDPVEILYAPNGKIATEVALKELPDLIIMDWDMPVMSGIDATKLISSQKETSDIPIIISTGVMTTPNDLKLALESGAVDFVRKPYNHIELIARINAALKLSRAHKEIQLLSEKEKQNLQQEIAHKERELSSNFMKAHERKKSFEQSKELVIKLEKNASEINKPIFKELKRLLQNISNAENTWDQFVVQFEKVHPNFFNKLKGQHPQLTINDLKLCAYIRIGLNNKEIATHTGIAYFSVKKNINRLKKKLNLDQDHDIRTVLLTES